MKNKEKHHVGQTTTIELQKKYYVDFITENPKWHLDEIYADEGISGTSAINRETSNRMVPMSMTAKNEFLPHITMPLKILHEEEKDIEEE